MMENERQLSHARSPSTGSGSLEAQRKKESGHRLGRLWRMNTDSLKMPWRVSEWPKQAHLASPSLTLHTLPTLPRCQHRSTKLLSEHTERANFFR